MKSSGTIDLREGPILKKLILFAFPVILSSVLQRLYNMADMIIAGKYVGNHALASIGATSTVTLILVMVFLGFSVGSGVLSAHFFGANDRKGLNDCLHTSFYVSLVIGVFLYIAAQLSAETILRVMNVPEDIFSDALSYVKISFVGLPASMCFNSLNAVSRAVGETKKPMTFLAVSGALNVVLNIVFVVWFKWGIAGIAWATVISNYLSAILVIIQFVIGTGDAKFNFGKFNFSMICLKRIVRLSLPPGFNYLLIGITDSVVQSAVNVFGSECIAGHVAASNVFVLFTLFMSAMNQATLTFAGQNYGVKNYDRIKEGYKVSEKAVFVISVVMLGMYILLRRPLLKLYTTDPLALKAGECYVFICGISSIAYFMRDNITSILNGLGKTFETMLVSVITIGGMRILWNYTIFLIFKSYIVLLISYSVSWIAGYIISRIMIHKEMKKLL